MAMRKNSDAIFEVPMNDEKYPAPASLKDHVRGRQFSTAGDNVEIVAEDTNKLKRNLHGRHMQMIAIGGAIGAGLFVGSGSALASGGPASLLICFIIIGVMMLCMMQALGELAVMYPVNGAFYTYICRFIDPSWGFAVGWDYAIQWLTILPFEITAAGITITFWHHYNIGIWVGTFLGALVIVQFFGVRGYGEVEFVLSIIKLIACTGFFILGIIINVGGVPGPHYHDYIGGKYWHDPGAFANGFKGFCTVFVVASFAYGGTELTGLAAAEADNPRKQIPKATKQVFWRIAFLYVLNLLLIGLIVPSNDPRLLKATGANTAYSPFVIAIENAGIKALPSIFNAVITISVLSVANSATYASTRTLQALATRGMAPKILAYVDKQGRPVPTVILQLLFGCLAFINESETVGNNVFTWLLSLSGLVNFFTYGSICLAHIRFRKAWKYNGHSVDELPYQASYGVWGSWFGLFLNVICLMAQFYVALFPLGSSPNAETFFESFLAAPLLIFFYLVWKIYSWFYVPEHRPLYVAIKDMDIYTGMRDDQKDISEVDERTRMASITQLELQRKKTFWDYPKGVLTALF